ncbi:acyl-CoA N-acyltransferase [Hypoxylon sp. NC1633]|nr:acyl-CoA N-acyltransferase [Hypoxylon sp. NC1633]
MEDGDDWTVDANEALTISLVRPSSRGIEKAESFKPKFTYAIFGEEERIFGYKSLKVNLQFDARDLRPNLSVSFPQKYPSNDNAEAIDVRSIMKGYLPPVAFQPKNNYEQAIKSIPDTWTPPGSLLKSFDKNGDTYEIWYGTLNDSAIRQLVRRIQITVLLFIEGGSYVGVDEDGKNEPDYSLARWSVFFVYKKAANPEGTGQPQYSFQGYATTYKFWMFEKPSSQKTKLSWQALGEQFSTKKFPDRLRISQFLILPPFQGKGVGALLYNTIFEFGMGTDSTKEITVEDPNEEFDVLRDLCDIKYLRKNVPEFAGLKINSDVRVPAKSGYLYHTTQISPTPNESSSSGGIVDVAKLEEVRVHHKIAPRQFWRLVEMHLMSKLPDSVRPRLDVESEKPKASKADKHTYTLWRLLLKQRLYRRNKVSLGEFEITERIIKLNEIVVNVEFEYATILDRLESKSAVTGSKRKLNGDADEEGSSKKVRLGA